MQTQTLDLPTVRMVKHGKTFIVEIVREPQNSPLLMTGDVDAALDLMLQVRGDGYPVVFAYQP